MNQTIMLFICKLWDYALKDINTRNKEIQNEKS
jgi:hypothetical protein